jgi:hypothetical protein
MKHYEVHGSKPGAERKGYPQQWRQNITCHVVAESLQKAVQLTLEAHPDAELHSVSHRGMVDIIDQTFIDAAERSKAE